LKRFRRTKVGTSRKERKRVRLWIGLENIRRAHCMRRKFGGQSVKGREGVRTAC